MTQRVAVPAWSVEEDTFLLSTVDDLKGTGSKVKEVFPVAAQLVTEKFGVERTKDASSYRYYQVKKKQRETATMVNTTTTITSDSGVTAEISVRAASPQEDTIKDEVAVASLDVIELTDGFIEMLEQSKNILLQLKRSNAEIGTENQQLKDERNKLQAELERVLQENHQLAEDNKHFYLIMDKARKLHVDEELAAAGITAYTSSPSFKAERNGNLVAK